MQGNIENKLHDWSPERQTSQEATRLWLEAYYSNAEGDLIFATPSGISWRRYTTASLKDCSLDAVASQVHGKSQLYLKINTMDRERIVERGRFAVGRNSELVEVVSFHADIDCDKRPTYPTRSFALEKLHSLAVPPSMIVGSGGPFQGGLHVSWILDHPLVIGDQLNELRALSKRFQMYIAEAIQPFESDKLSNLERVLRVVGSVRSDGVSVALLELNERRYSIDDIRNACPSKDSTV